LNNFLFSYELILNLHTKWTNKPIKYSIIRVDYHRSTSPILNYSQSMNPKYLNFYFHKNPHLNINNILKISIKSKHIIFSIIHQCYHLLLLFSIFLIALKNSMVKSLIIRNNFHKKIFLNLVILKIFNLKKKIIWTNHWISVIWHNNLFIKI